MTTHWTTADFQDDIAILTAALEQLPSVNSTTTTDTWFSVPGPWPTEMYFYMDYRTGECFRVDEDIGIMTEQQVSDKLGTC